MKSTADAQSSPSLLGRAVSIIGSILPSVRATAVSTRDDTATDSITVVCISDTHTTTPELPPGDLLIHSGDLSLSGSFAEIQAQLTWLSSQTHRYKVVIAGNHDLLLDSAFVDRFPERISPTQGAEKQDLDWGDLLYLCDEAVTLDFEGGRKLTVYGSPWTQQFGNWAFQFPPIRDVWTGKLPRDTNVLVTHGPPLSILDDGGKGNAYLLRELRRVMPELVVFGHIHAGHGAEELTPDQLSTACDNLSAGRKNWRSVIDSTLVRWRSRKKTTAMRFVNAAVVGGKHNEIQRPAKVVTL